MFVMSPCEMEFENPQNLGTAAFSLSSLSKKAQNSRSILSSSKCFIGMRSFAGNADSYSALTCGNHGDFFVTLKNWSISAFRKNNKKAQATVVLLGLLYLKYAVLLDECGK